MELLTQLRERQEQLDSHGVTLIGVGTREDYQARALMADGIGVELLLDPADQLRAALGADARFPWWRLLHPRGLPPYVRAARQAKRFDPIWTEANQRPGLLLLDADLEPLWSRMGSRIGDYPSADRVLSDVAAALDVQSR